MGDPGWVPPVLVSREAHVDGGVRMTIEWVSGRVTQARMVELAADDLARCALSRTEPLDQQWSVKLYQHRRAGRRVVMAALFSRDLSTFRDIKIIDRDTDFVAFVVDGAGTPRPLVGEPTLRPFRSDLTPLRGRRLRVMTEAPTDDAGTPQALPVGLHEAIADADAVGPGLTVRVRIPEAPGVTAHIAWDQLAFYDEPPIQEH